VREAAGAVEAGVRRQTRSLVPDQAEGSGDISLKSISRRINYLHNVNTSAIFYSLSAPPRRSSSCNRRTTTPTYASRCLHDEPTFFWLCGRLEAQHEETEGDEGCTHELQARELVRNPRKVFRQVLPQRRQVELADAERRVRVAPRLERLSEPKTDVGSARAILRGAVRVEEEGDMTVVERESKFEEVCGNVAASA
jgi:hypothetical protein